MGGDGAVGELLDLADEVLLSAIVLGELTHGALNSRSPDDNIVKLAELRRECRFAPVDEAVVATYGRVRLLLKQKGRPIPENDIWICATALANGASVLTHDAHFKEVEGLTIASWD